MIAERALQHGAQARERRNGREGIAVGLNNTGIGIRLQEGLQSGEVGRRLEHPLRPRTAPLQMLQEAAMEVIRRSEVGVVDPGLVRRDPEGGGELRAPKDMTGDGHTPGVARSLHECA